MLRHQQFIRTLALTGMAIAALIAPHAASARPAADPQHVLQAKHVLVDLRTPDAVTPVVIQPTNVDLRSPDAATPVQLPQTNVDLRSPDTQVPVQPTAPKIGAPVARPTSTDDFDFGSAAVGAGIALLIALAAVGSMVAIQRRRPVTLGH
jgi:hypothetical protein